MKLERAEYAIIKLKECVASDGYTIYGNVYLTSYIRKSFLNFVHSKNIPNIKFDEWYEE